MTLDETYELLDRITLVDDRVVRSDEAEADAQVRMWATALMDVPLDFAGEAVGAHYREHPWPVRPSDITARWRTECRNRMERHAERRAPAADPDDPQAYRAALLAERRAVVTGQEPPAAVRALTAAVGRSVEVAQPNPGYLAAKAACLPQREEPAGPPEWAVGCPSCGAAPGRACRTLHRGRVMRGTHPDRRRNHLVAEQQEAG
ncbi:hypothetical protein ACIGW3_26125 [Streptomyces sp. NPDC053499]|uniref:zinc finger domain-containing protein n=1 Tax=Streptomyces sp. NPDC053499 TaxID=3365707 RepID=UPI0037CE70E5